MCFHFNFNSATEMDVLVEMIDGGDCATPSFEETARESPCMDISHPNICVCNDELMISSEEEDEDSDRTSNDRHRQFPVDRYGTMADVEYARLREENRRLYDIYASQEAMISEFKSKIQALQTEVQTLRLRRENRRLVDASANQVVMIDGLKSQFQALQKEVQTLKSDEAVLSRVTPSQAENDEVGTRVDELDPQEVATLSNPGTTQDSNLDSRAPVKDSSTSKKFKIGRNGTKQILQGRSWMRACVADGCEKASQKATKYCVEHGGGNRCREQGCPKSALGKTGYCTTHGGGEICGKAGCPTRARGSTGYCAKHGGGKRRRQEGQGKTVYCVKRGNWWKECMADGCKKKAAGSAGRSTDYCIRHGGGRRCESEVCMVYDDPVDRGPGRYKAPSDRTHGTVFIKKDTPLCFACMGSAYPECVTLKVRQEHLILAEIQRLLPELEQWFEEWDCPVSGGCSLKRPDMLWEMPNFYLHMEVDEDGEMHEDNRERLDEIYRAMGKHRPGLVIRINARGILRKKQHRDGEIKYSATKHFEGAMDKVVEFIRENILAEMGGDGMGVPKVCTHGKVVVHKLLF